MNACKVCHSHAHLRCNRCKKAVYCGIECQKKDWLLHRMVCISPEEVVQTVLTEEDSIRDKVKKYLHDRDKLQHEHWLFWGLNDPYYGYISEGRYAYKSLGDIIYNLRKKRSTFEDLEEAHKIHWDRARCEYDSEDKKSTRVAKGVCNQVRICLFSQGYTWELIQQVLEMPEYEYPSDAKIKDGSIRTLFTSKHTRNYMLNHFPDVLAMYGRYFISKLLKEELYIAVKKHNVRVSTLQSIAYIKLKMNILGDTGIPFDCTHLIMEFLHNKNIMLEVTKTL